MLMLSRHYDVIFEENLQKLFNFFIYDVIQTLNRRINIDILIKFLDIHYIYNMA